MFFKLRDANATEYLNGIDTKQQFKIQELPSHNQHISYGSVTSCHANSDEAASAAGLRSSS